MTLYENGYGIRAPGAVALGTLRPRYAEIQEFGSASGRRHLTRRRIATFHL